MKASVSVGRLVCAAGFLVLCSVVVTFYDALYLLFDTDTGMTVIESGTENETETETENVHSLGGGISGLAMFLPISNNSKHSLSFYGGGINQLCAYYQSFTIPNATETRPQFSFIGDIATISDITSDGCQPFLPTPTMQPKKVFNFTFNDLRYEAETVVNSGQFLGDDCGLKFGMRIANRPFHNMVRLWLNKVTALCDYADAYSRNGDTFHYLIDAGIMSHHRTMAKSWITNIYKRNRDEYCSEGHLCAVMYGNNTRTYGWFRKQECTQPPTVTGGLLGIRRKDCPAVISAYQSVIANISALNPKGCRCYDEEMALTFTRMQFPHLITKFRF